MNLAATRSGDVLIFRIQDQTLDRKNRLAFKKAIGAHLRPGVKIAVGLDNVRRADGLGCGAVLTLEKATTDLGGEIRFFALHKPVRTLFQRLRLNRRVHLHEAEEEAVCALQHA
jgi:anti-anti-sigma regulatory factor